MKAVKMDMDVVNCVLLIVILALVIYCCVKQGETFMGNGLKGHNHKNNLAPY